MKSRTASTVHWIALVGSTTLAPVVVRVSQISDARIALRLADLRGFAADLALALVLAAGIAALPKTRAVGRWVGAVLIGIWCLVHFANYEHVRELGSVVDLSQAGYMMDPTFFRGSVLAPTHPVLLAVTTLIAIGMVVWALGGDAQFRPHLLVVAAVPLVAVTVLMPRTEEVANWRQTDIVSAQIRGLLKTRLKGEPSATARSSRLARRDLGGTPIITAEPQARNVLLIILEGVSGAYLPSLREHHGAGSSVTMPELDRVARTGLSYASFVATQRQTNRGEYALLCGDYPKLVSAEANMTELVGRGPLDCLPAVMREAGFQTVYLQAAPLPFMMKDQFMPQAGFEQVHGDAWFEHAYNRNHWGVDDRSFFERSLTMIEDLQRGDHPWFLTLLTVGTHHRYNVPPDFVGQSEPGSAAWAFEYLDRAVGEFIPELKTRGVLDDTLVLITSDESQAMEAGIPDWMNAVTQSWGFLIALLPSRESGVIDQIFTQPDLPISVLDYLRIASAHPEYTGRSVFRRYKDQRAVYWGNAHLRMVGGVSPELRLTICSEDFGTCGTIPVADRTLFAPDKRVRAATAEETDWLREAAQRSLAVRSARLERRRLVLIRPGRHPILPTSSEQYIFG